MNLKLIKAGLICQIFLYFSFLWVKPIYGNSSTVSPPSDFLIAPQNKTVSEGQQVILRCKMTDIVQKCQWYYLQFGMNLFDERFEPILAKEFRPTLNRDCSIKFNNARSVQAGQWICKGLQIHAYKYVISPPAFLTVISNESDYTTESTSEGRSDNGLDFIYSNEGHIVNTKLGEAALITCQTNRELSSCSWIKPDGLSVQYSLDKNGNYYEEGNKTKGNCSVFIKKVTPHDEGNWRCVVSGKDTPGEKLGPVVHLHIHEFGEHSEGIERFFSDGNTTSSLPMILGITSAILIGIIIALVFFIYKKTWRLSCYPHKHISCNASERSDYSNYEVSFHPELRNREYSFDGRQSARLSNSSEPISRAGYLDMTGRSSMASRASLSTLPLGCNMSDRSIMASAHENSICNARSTPADINVIQGRRLPEILPSTDSHDHLYEEIKGARGDSNNSDDIIDEFDKEGYLIPSHCSSYNTLDNKHAHTLEKTIAYKDSNPPPYPSVNDMHEKETELVKVEDKLLDLSYLPKEVNEDKIERESSMNLMRNEKSYDIPNEENIPIAPERTDSKDTPLSNYDVPTKRDNIVDSTAFV